jgi:hypothetical protein
MRFDVTIIPFSVSIIICLYIYYTILRDRTDLQREIDKEIGRTYFVLFPLSFLAVILMVVLQLIINLFNYIIN